jgi:hypothetical protein
MKRSLVIFAIPLDVAKLPRLPFVLYGIMGGIERVTVGMEMRIRPTFHRSGGEMDELTPYHVSGLPVFLGIVDPDTSFHLAFNLAHGFSHGFSECAQNTFIASQGMDYGNTLRTVEIEIISHPAMVIGSGGQSIVGIRALIIAQSLEGFLIHPAFQSQKISAFALPLANNLLFLSVIFPQSIRISLVLQIAGIVILGLSNIFTTDDPQHNDIAPFMVIGSEFRDKRGTDVSPWHSPRPGEAAQRLPTNSHRVGRSWEHVGTSLPRSDRIVGTLSELSGKPWELASHRILINAPGFVQPYRSMSSARRNR